MPHRSARCAAGLFLQLSTQTECHLKTLCTQPRTLTSFEPQVDTLRGLYLELRETLEALAGDVASGQQEAARRMLAATREQLDAHRTLLEGGCRMAEPFPSTIVPNRVRANSRPSLPAS